MAGGAADRWFHIYTHAMTYVNDITYIYIYFPSYCTWDAGDDAAAADDHDAEKGNPS